MEEILRGWRCAVFQRRTNDIVRRDTYSAECIAEARRAFIVEGVGLAEDER